mmetsp:Transcript_72209/g.143274  ORF Transcript_72209/g.143274 Transcript_72209/m.143274 type:complete len:360 (+) Transcript_72209:338-1417(+)
MYHVVLWLTWWVCAAGFVLLHVHSWCAMCRYLWHASACRDDTGKLLSAVGSTKQMATTYKIRSARSHSNLVGVYCHESRELGVKKAPCDNEVLLRALRCGQEAVQVAPDLGSLVARPKACHRLDCGVVEYEEHAAEAIVCNGRLVAADKGAACQEDICKLFEVCVRRHAGLLALIFSLGKLGPEADGGVPEHIECPIHATHPIECKVDGGLRLHVVTAIHFGTVLSSNVAPHGVLLAQPESSVLERRDCAKRVNLEHFGSLMFTLHEVDGNNLAAAQVGQQRAKADAHGMRGNPVDLNAALHRTRHGCQLRLELFGRHWRGEHREGNLCRRFLAVRRKRRGAVGQGDHIEAFLAGSAHG